MLFAERQLPFHCTSYTVRSIGNYLLSFCSSEKSNYIRFFFQARVFLDLCKFRVILWNDKVEPENTGSFSWVCFSWNLPGSVNFSICAVPVELSDLDQKNVNTNFPPQLPMNYDFFASSSVDQLHIDSETDWGCEACQIFNETSICLSFNESSSLIGLQRCRSSRKQERMFVICSAAIGNLWLSFWFYPKTVIISTKRNKKHLTRTRNWGILKVEEVCACSDVMWNWRLRGPGVGWKLVNVEKWTFFWNRGENKKPFLVAKRNRKVKQSPWKEKKRT